MRHKFINIFIIGLYIYSTIGLALLCFATQTHPTILLPLCIIAWISLFGLALFLGRVYIALQEKTAAVYSKETTEDVYYHFHEYQQKTFYAITEVHKGKLTIQPVHLLHISAIDTTNIFYFNDQDCVFLETQVNMLGHNLWTTRNAARAELCRRNPEVTLEDLNNEQKT